jgi:hypothetical protein
MNQKSTNDTLQIGSLQLPVESATKTFAVLAKRGAGKTYTAAVLAEEFFKTGVPFVVFDPIDVWWGLRLDKSGTGKGLPVIVFGLEHADIPLERDMGRAIARAIVSENVSCIISTFGMPKVAQRQLITELAEELLTLNDTPRHIFIEEAHEFVPQRVFGDMGKTFNAVSNLVTMGRNRGLGVTLINQRAATMNKDVLTQVDTLLAFRNVAPQDRKALREWVEYHAAEGDFEAFMKSLPTLPTGEGWIWSPEFLQTFERIKIRKRETFHPDREKLGNRFVVPQFERIDVQQFIERFKSLATKKEERVIPKTASKNVPPVVDTTALKRAYEEKLTSLAYDYEQKLKEKDEEIQRLTTTVNSIRSLLGETTNGKPAQANSTFQSGNLDVWVRKVGQDTGAGRILRYLAEKSGLKLSRAQIALGVGMSANGGTFRDYIATLLRNNLVVQSDGFIWINPELGQGNW